MSNFDAKQVNLAFAHFVPELTSKWAQYPLTRDRWLNFQETFDGKPTFIAATEGSAKEKEMAVKEDYVYCKVGPMGKGYYHVLTKTVYVNLYSRLSSQGPPGGGCCGAKSAANNKDGQGGTADEWDTARLVIYARSRASRPDDNAAFDQQIDHMAGTKINPAHGLKP